MIKKKKKRNDILINNISVTSLQLITADNKNYMLLT